MFGNLLSNVAKLAVNVATAPVAVAADVVTLGGALVDRDEPYTVSQAGKILENVEDIVEDDLDD